jgi:hypothetical protein
VTTSPPRPRRTRALSELVAGVLEPVSAKRSAVAASLATAWPELVGPRYADCTFPEKIDWPRGEDSGGGGVLRVRADGPRTVLLQHELGQLAERVNAYLGYGAIARIRLVQGPVPRRAAKTAPSEPRAIDETRLAETVAPVSDDALRAALARLGRGVLAGRR